MPTPFARAPLVVLALLVLSACAGADAEAGDPLADAPVAGAAVADSAVRPDGVEAPDAEGPGTLDVAAGVEEGDASRREPTRAESAGGSVAPAPVRIPERRPSFRRPEHVRGVYLNKWAAGSAGRVEQLVGLARRTEVNAFVIDLKDASGYLSYASAVPLAREIGATGDVSIRDLPGLLQRLSDEGIWPIARIVIVKDPILAAARPDLAVQDTAGGPWLDRHGVAWLNPWSQEVRDYHLALAREAAALGFPEIQWDYVRFADAPLEDLLRAEYPGRDGREKAEAIRDFLEASDSVMEELGVVHTADVFGVTTSARDVGIGQIWERFIDRLDVALPMVYPSHYWRGSFGIQRPNAHPYEIIREALKRGLARSEAVEGAGTIRPWLQDFTMGEPRYGAPEVLAQIQAAYDLGIQEWLLWNPGSRYTEEALRPAGGWTEEPLVRVADRHVPLSRRHEALRLAAALDEERRAGKEAPLRAPAASSEGGGQPGSEGAGEPTPRGIPGLAVPRPDSVRSPALRPDTVRADTVRPRILDRDSLRRRLDSLSVRDTLPTG